MTYILRIMLCGLFVLPSLSHAQPLTEQELRLEVYKHAVRPCFKMAHEAIYKSIAKQDHRLSRFSDDVFIREAFEEFIRGDQMRELNNSLIDTFVPAFKQDDQLNNADRTRMLDTLKAMCVKLVMDSLAKKLREEENDNLRKELGITE